jgi:hypothetical protein
MSALQLSCLGEQASYVLGAAVHMLQQIWGCHVVPQVNGIKDSLKTATATASMPPQDNRYVAANEKFVQNEYQQQQMIMQ